MIQFGSALIQVHRDWPAFKAVLDGTEKSLVLQEEDEAHQHQLFAVDQGVVYSTTLYDADHEPIGWTQQQKDDNATWLADYEANWEPAANKCLTVPVPILQERDTNGHYNIESIDFECPAGETRYSDLVVPAFTNGWDWLNFRFDTAGCTAGDQIATGKALIGQFAALAADATTGATSITIVTKVGIAMPTKQGGKIDEGYYISIGTESSTAAAINAVPPPGTGSFINPEGELREYRIKRIGPQALVGGGLATVTLELFAPLEADGTTGAAVNLVVRAVPAPLTIRPGGVLDIGKSATMAGNLPAGAIVRLGYRNTGASTFRVIGQFDVLY